MNARRRRNRRPMLEPSRWTPAALLLSHRRSSNAMSDEPRTTRLCAHRRSWLAGRCLPSALCGMLAGLSSTARTRRWERSRTPEAQLETRRKWRALLWGEWTRARFAPPPTAAVPAGCVSIPSGLQLLGARSLRDEYFLSRARALSRAAGISGCSYDIAGWLRQPGLRQAPSNRTAGAKTSQGAAGLLTPVSSRNRKKKSRGGSGGQAT